MAPATQTPAAPSTALTVINTAEQYTTQLATIQQRYNVLTPFAQIGGLAPQHAIFPTVIMIDPNPAAGDVYDGVTKDGRQGLQYLKAGEVALAKNGLRKVAEGLGISIVKLEHLAVGVPNYWHVQVTAAYRGVDGQWVIRSASFEWDLRDGSDRMRGWTPGQIAEARKNGLRQCETRAINAAIRECGAGVKQSYRRDELTKPFIAFRVNFVPDMTDADTRRIVTERAMQGASALFAQQQAPAAAAPATSEDPFADVVTGTVTGTVIDVGSGSTARPAVTPAPVAPPPAAKQDEPPTPDSVKITDIKFKDGETRGRPWRRYTITDKAGNTYSTFNANLASLAEQFKRENTWVEIVDQGDQYHSIIEIAKAGEQPDLAGLET